MPITQALNSKANVKKFTNNDIPYSTQQPVLASYYATSTAGQTTISNLGFSIDTVNNPDTFFLFVDGKKLTLGSANDFTFASVAVDGTSSAIALNQSLPAGLNISAYKMGLKKESEFLTDNRFTQLYAAETSGFQGFISQTDAVITPVSSSGTPAAGTFYSSIPNRSSMPDLSQDLKPRIGIERIMVEGLQPLQTEIGPNGEQVFTTPNDIYGQIRFVGSWGYLDDAYGQRTTFATNTTDVVEVVFYGTGLNALMQLGFSGNNLAISIDGGTETTGLATSSYASILNARNYSINNILPLVSNLTLGIHTAKIRQTNTASPAFYGFEIINSNSTNVVTNPGTAYASGQKIALSSASSIAYNNAVTGTRGGRVLQYLSSSGKVAQAWTPVNTAAAYLTSTDHTNEDIARTYNFREFGAGRSDDFSAVVSSGSLAFTLDDGTTTLVGSTLNTNNTFYGGNQQIGFGTNGFVRLTFVGSGLDMIGGIGGGSVSTLAVTVDGVSVGTIPLPAAATNIANTKIVSGLPYGTHTVQITYGSSGGWGVLGFRVWQPKKPTLPSGAVELGDYCVFANYVASTVNQSATIQPSTGVLFKASARETLYVGTWGTGYTTNYGTPSGGTAGTSTVGDSFQVTFFGTGIELALGCATATATATVAIDGSNYTGTATIPVGGTWTAGSSTVSLTSGAGYIQTLQITGLTLGLHTIKVTVTAAGGTFYNFWNNIITPTYSYKSNIYADYQSSLNVGSSGISDNRKITPVKDSLPVVKSWTQALPVTATVTTTSTSPIPMTDMSCTVKTSSQNGAIQVIGCVSLANNSVASNTTTIAIYVDGSQVGEPIQFSAQKVGGYVPLTVQAIVPVGSGVHKIDLYWYVDGSTYIAGNRILTVREL